MFFKKKAKNLKNIKTLPTHIGIIMDGNGRWAKSRGMPRKAGHTFGAQKFKDITIYCSKIGIKYLTVYAFSTENWKRPKEEIDALMKLFKQYLEEALRDFINENIKVNFIGDTEVFSKELKDLILDVKEASKNKTGMVLNIAMNYGGRDEILMAVKNIAQNIKSGALLPEDINFDTISDRLYTKGQPDPDVIIRPSGEYRTSNFLMWQSAYSEYVFMDILWPDFTARDIQKALEEFSLRNRRFGGI